MVLRGTWKRSICPSSGGIQQPYKQSEINFDKLYLKRYLKVYVIYHKDSIFWEASGDKTNVISLRPLGFESCVIWYISRS